MTDVSVTDLKNHGREIVDRVANGEHVTITRSGRPVARLSPAMPAAVSAAALVRRRRHLMPVDPDGLRADIDATLATSL